MRRKNRHHLHLLCDIGELAALLTGSENIENFLQNTVELVARHMKADVCSIYLFEEKSDELVLNATIGLNRAAVGQVRMKIGEGLVGTTLEKLQPVNVGVASRNPRFKYFEEADEDRFDSFLAVPILRGDEKIGVMVVQHEKPSYFDDLDVMALRAIASQLAGTIGNARFLMNLSRGGEHQAAEPPISSGLRFIKGAVAVQGYAYAPVTIFDKTHATLLEAKWKDGTGYTLNHFYQAIKATSAQLEDYQSRFAERLPESVSMIFSSHLMILKDMRFVNEIEKKIKSGVSPPAAIKAVAHYYIERFAASSYAHIREKANDVQDLSGRLLKNLGKAEADIPVLGENQIVIARELYPSDILRLASEAVKGIILVSGGVASHVAILSRSLRIPLIIANRPELLRVLEGTPVLMDGELGNIYVKPSDRVVSQFESQIQAMQEFESNPPPLSPTTRTRDGVRVRLLANINLLGDLALARQLKAEGVGLYRTEFPFLIRSSIPSEEEQYLVYKRLFEEMPGKEVTIRTLDLGGDKLLAYADAAGDANPELGLRSIRFSLRHRDIFHQQLRAILRAAAEAEKLRIMFPMISSLDEFDEARQDILDCIAGLEHDRLSHHTQPQIGVMIELPSVLEIIDEMCEAADFISIGTNDFIQYMLAVDRTNENVAEYYRPYHPAILRALAKITHAAIRCDKEVSICGEMARDSQYIPFLLGIGVRALSVHPRFLLAVQKVITDLRICETEAYANKLLSESTIRGIHETLQNPAD